MWWLYLQCKKKIAFGFRILNDLIQCFIRIDSKGPLEVWEKLRTHESWVSSY